MILRVELVTKSSRTRKQFLAELSREGILIKDWKDTKDSSIYLLNINFETGQRLFVPCRAIIEYPSRFTV